MIRNWGSRFVFLTTRSPVKRLRWAMLGDWPKKFVPLFPPFIVIGIAVLSRVLSSKHSIALNFDWYLLWTHALHDLVSLPYSSKKSSFFPHQCNEGRKNNKKKKKYWNSYFGKLSALLHPITIATLQRGSPAPTKLNSSFGYDTHMCHHIQNHIFWILQQ